MICLNAFVLRSCKGRNFKYLIRSTLPILLICLGWLSFTNTEFLHEESRYHHWAIAIAPPAQSWPGWDGQHAQIHPRHCCRPLLEDPEHMVHYDLELRLRCSFSSIFHPNSGVHSRNIHTNVTTALLKLTKRKNKRNFTSYFQSHIQLKEQLTKTAGLTLWLSGKTFRLSIACFPQSHH